MATPGSAGGGGAGGAGQEQQTPPPRSTGGSRRSRPQSLYFRDKAATPGPGVRPGKLLGTSPSWNDQSAGVGNLHPPPIKSLDECHFDPSSSTSGGGGGSDMPDLAVPPRTSSFSSPWGGGGGTGTGGSSSFSRSPAGFFTHHTPSLTRIQPRQQDSSGTTRKGFGSPYSDAAGGGGLSPSPSPLQSQRLHFHSPEWQWPSKGKEAGGAAAELVVAADSSRALAPESSTQGGGFPGTVSFLRPGAGGWAAVEGQDWVTVYGFASTELHLVLREFEKCGPIVTYMPGPAGSNYGHLQFHSRHDAAKAVQKNGTQLSATVLVGVKPVDALHLPALLREVQQQQQQQQQQQGGGSASGPGAGPAVSPPHTPRKDVLTASTSRPYYLNGAEAQGPQPLRPLAAPVRSAVSRLVDLVFGV